jgi:hypothetical protein
MKTLAVILLSFGFAWCDDAVTEQHHETALYYGGAIERAQAMDCQEVLGLLRCDVYHPYGAPIEMWCNAAWCEYVDP